MVRDCNPKWRLLCKDKLSIMYLALVADIFLRKKNKNRIKSCLNFDCWVNMFKMFEIWKWIWKYWFLNQKLTEICTYGRKDWLKIGQDQEMAAVALLNIDVRKAFCDWTLVSLDIFFQTWNYDQTEKSQIETVVLVDLI